MTRRLRAAALLTPLVPSLVFTVLLAPSPAGQGLLFSVLTFTVPLTVLPFWLFVMPTVYWLRRRGWLNVPTVVALGALTGAAVWYAFIWLFSLMLQSHDLGPLPFRSAYGVAIGMPLALFFSLVAGLPWKAQRTIPPGQSTLAT